MLKLSRGKQVLSLCCTLCFFLYTYTVIIPTGVRGSKGFLDGEHFWEIIFLEPPAGTSVMVGVGTKKALLHTNNYQYVDLIGTTAFYMDIPTIVCGVFPTTLFTNIRNEEHIQPNYPE